METEKTSQSTLENQNEVTPVVVRKEPERDLFTWSAASRPFQKRPREFYVTLFAIVGIVSLILFIAEGVMPVILLIAVVFLFYVLSTVAPEKIEYKITSKGVKIAGNLSDWRIMDRFWFIKRADSDLLLIETFVLPGRMEIVVNSEDKEVIRKHLSSYISEEEIKPTGLEKAVSWFSSKLPGNK